MAFKDHSKSLETSRFDRTHTIFCYRPIETMALSCIVFDILPDIGRKSRNLYQRRENEGRKEERKREERRERKRREVEERGEEQWKAGKKREGREGKGVCLLNF